METGCPRLEIREIKASCGGRIELKRVETILFEGALFDGALFGVVTSRRPVVGEALRVAVRDQPELASRSPK